MDCVKSIRGLMSFVSSREADPCFCYCLLSGQRPMSVVVVLQLTVRCHDVTATSTGRGQHNKSAGTDRYKTELCRTFEESGRCRYGDKCQFAHGPGELRTVQRHPKYKTDLCRTFHTTGFCPYGSRCHFIHQEHRPPSPASTESRDSNVGRLLAGLDDDTMQLLMSLIERRMSASTLLTDDDDLSSTCQQMTQRTQQPYLLLNTFGRRSIIA